MTDVIGRVLEPEVMDDLVEVRAYSEADFRKVNTSCARRALRLAGKASGHAIDLGTGPAEIPILLCQMAPGWQVTAVDASANMLRAARANVKRSELRERIQLRRGNVQALRRVQSRFELVFSNSLLHHLDDPLPFWREVRRLTKQGGAVIVQDLARPRSRSEARQLVRRHAEGESALLRQLFYQSLLAAFTTAEVREQLNAAGLPGLKVRRLNDRHLVVRGHL